MKGRKKKVKPHLARLGEERRKELANLTLAERWRREQAKVKNKYLVFDRTSEKGANIYLSAKRLAERLEEGSVELKEGYYYAV